MKEKRSSMYKGFHLLKPFFSLKFFNLSYLCVCKVSLKSEFDIDSHLVAILDLPLKIC